MFFSHVNDPGFWLVKGDMGTSTADTFRTWSLLETVISVAGLVMVAGSVTSYDRVQSRCDVRGRAVVKGERLADRAYTAIVRMITQANLSPGERRPAAVEGAAGENVRHVAHHRARSAGAARRRWHHGKRAVVQAPT
nr:MULTISPECIES: hypothetical protein [unclassified Sphingomonas]